MCGILCRIGSSQNEIPSSLTSRVNVENNYTFWETNDEGYISDMIREDLSETVTLSPADQRKLDNLGEIRSLNAKLNKIKNQIGKSLTHSEEIKTEKRVVEEMISQLSNLDTSEEESISKAPSKSSTQIFDSLISVIASRGPNYIQYVRYPVSSMDDDSSNQLAQSVVEQFSSVLSLRQPFHKQPIQMEDIGISLQFNGELYNNECLESNDTEFITERLKSNIQSGDNNSRRESILKTLGELDGEFAYVIIDTKTNKCYFGRDFVGRRSLLFSQTDDASESVKEILISSIAAMDSPWMYTECKAEVVYCYDMATGETVTHPLVVKGAREFKPISTALYHPAEESDTAPAMESKLSAFKDIFLEACKVRIDTIHPIHEDSPLVVNVGILFSGGLDCTMIAAAIAYLIDTDAQISTSSRKVVVDLLSVGFDNPRTQVPATDSPDRKLARKSFTQLASSFNSAKLEYRLVEIDVSYEEWLRHGNRVKRLMYPCDTEMDLSIAIAFYFASRGENGTLITVDSEGGLKTEKNFTSSAKVLLSGLGADELFAGYSRHENCFNSLKPPIEANEEYSEETVLAKAYADLAAELTSDIKKIYQRNLGRDDRVISSWGKELRYPFLDEKVINHVMQKVELDCKFHYSWESVTNKKGVTRTRMKPIRKYFLRQFAKMLGCEWVSDEPKRAIQFGAKSAKMEIGQSKTKGTDQLD